MVNAHFLYKAINDQSISITDFKESVVECLFFRIMMSLICPLRQNLTQDRIDMS
nr:unnamed protein product [Callosobruchus chinensis]